MLNKKNKKKWYVNNLDQHFTYLKVKLKGDNEVNLIRVLKYTQKSM